MKQMTVHQNKRAPQPTVLYCSTTELTCKNFVCSIFYSENQTAGLPSL